MIKIEPFDSKDFEILISWIDSEETLVQFAGPIFTFPLSNDQLSLYLSDSKRKVFKVREIKTKEVIGHGEVYLTSNKTARLCRIIIGKKTYRGLGLGQRIVNELLRYSFEGLLIEEVELNVYNWNTSAINCYEKVGFRINPLITKAINFNNSSWTSINMIINKFEWKKRNKIK